MTDQWVILDGFDGDRRTADAIGGTLRERLESMGKQYTAFRISDLHIAPCRSCGACGYKSPGKCVVNDDLHQILRAVAPCSVLVFLSPIRFGGYASKLKMALEKFMNLGSPYFTVTQGKLLHRLRYPAKALLSIGVTEGERVAEAETFQLLVRRNAQNLQCWRHKAVVLQPAALEAELNGVLEEVLPW